MLTFVVRFLCGLLEYFSHVVALVFTDLVVHVLTCVITSVSVCVGYSSGLLMWLLEWLLGMMKLLFKKIFCSIKRVRKLPKIFTKLEKLKTLKKKLSNFTVGRVNVIAP